MINLQMTNSALNRLCGQRGGAEWVVGQLTSAGAIA